MRPVNSNTLLYFLLILLMSVPLFSRLGQLPVQIWDESRLALNAYEMYKNGNYIVTYFEGEPDLWNTKPPLMIWMQVVCMKILGINELAIRLPSAIAALLTGLLLMVFSHRYLKDRLFGFLAAIFLVSFHGYVSLHGTRTGDYDALLTLFTTLSVLMLFLYMEGEKPRHLYLFFVFTAISVLTKSIQGLLFLPGIALYIVFQKKHWKLLRNKHFYLGSLLFLALAGSYYVLREAVNDGYLAAVQNNELLGRYTEVLEDNQQGFGFYFTKLALWNVFILSGFISGFYSGDQRIKKLSLFSFILTLSYLLIISLSKTKCAWYDIPVYPLIALLIAITVRQFYVFLKKKAFLRQRINEQRLYYLIVVLLLLYPYGSIVNSIYHPHLYPKRHRFYEITRYLQSASHGNIDLNKQYILYKGSNPHNLFYVHLLQDRGIDIEYKDWTMLEPGDVVIVSQDELKTYLSENYFFEVLSEEGNIETCRIHERKKEPES